MSQTTAQAYKLQFRFEPGTDTQFQDDIVYAFSVQIVVRGIHTVQSSASVLEFESERDRNYALLLANDPLYTVVAL